MDNKKWVAIGAAAFVILGGVGYGFNACGKKASSPSSVQSASASPAEATPPPEEAKAETKSADAAKSPDERQCLTMALIKNCHSVTPEELADCFSDPDAPGYLGCPPGVLKDCFKKAKAGQLDVCSCRYYEK